MAFGDQRARTEVRLLDFDGDRVGGCDAGMETGKRAGMPARGPAVTEPDRRKQVEHRPFGTAVGDRDPAQDVLGGSLRVFDGHVEVAVALEDTGIEQLVFRVGSGAASVLGDEVGVRECALRILVQEFHVRVRGRAVEIEVVLLDVLAVVAFGSCESEETFFQNGIAAVPERDREADELMAIANARQAVLVPAVGVRTRVVVGKVGPGASVRAVVFTDRAPGALADVRPPPFPVGGALLGLLKALLFGVHA